MNRRTTLTAVFLTLTAAAVGWETVAGLDSDPDTVPWTELIARYVPWPVALAVFTVLAVWLPPHFVNAYRKEHAMTDPLPAVPPPGAPTNPLLTVGGITAGIAALITLLTSFGLPLTDTQTQALLSLVAVAAPLVVAWWARRKVFAPSTVHSLVVRAEKRGAAQERQDAAEKSETQRGRRFPPAKPAT